MSQTPWGPSEQLAAGKLAPGGRNSPEEVARSQRERLYGATVALVAERGYERTTIAELVSLSGVSRSAFYRHFSDKEACFAATIEAVLGQLTKVVSLSYDGKGSGLQALVRSIASQPAAARICLLETHPAGGQAQEAVERLIGGGEALYAHAYAERNAGKQMPAEIVSAVVGGLRRVISAGVLRGKEDQLVARAAELWRWSFSYEPPPRPLRRRSRVQALDSPPAGEDAVGRILAGAAEALVARGYQETTIAEIVERSGVSLRTFYAHFSGKDPVFWAILDAGQAQMYARVLPAYRRTEPQGWPQAVRVGCETMFDFLAANPDFARLAFVETQLLGQRGLAAREESAEMLRPYFKEGYRLSAEASPEARQAIPGAVAALIQKRLLEQGAESLPEASATAVYLILAPFLGAEGACAVARGEA